MRDGYMNEDVMISVAMATYNGERFLHEQIDSILAQTHQNFELVICDDCSTDGTAGILREYETQDSRIHVYVNESNLGFKKNFERAISLCKGEYIALSDQDDVWLPEHLEKLLSIIGTADIACGNALMVDADGKPTGKMLNEIDNLYFFDAEKSLFRILFFTGPFQGASMLIKSAFVKRLLPFPEGVFAHDAWMAACSCFGSGIVYTFDAITKYRQHGNNVTFSTHNKKSRNIFEKSISRVRIFFGGVKVDRFCYCDELAALYGTDSKPFCEIYKVIKRIEKRHFCIQDIRFFWKNYEWIMTQKGHSGFLKRLISWSRWRRA